MNDIITDNVFTKDTRLINHSAINNKEKNNEELIKGVISMKQKTVQHIPSDYDNPIKMIRDSYGRIMVMFKKYILVYLEDCNFNCDYLIVDICKEVVESATYDNCEFIDFEYLKQRIVISVKINDNYYLIQTDCLLEYINHITTTSGLNLTRYVNDGNKCIITKINNQFKIVDIINNEINIDTSKTVNIIVNNDDNTKYYIYKNYVYEYVLLGTSINIYDLSYNPEETITTICSTITTTGTCDVFVINGFLFVKDDSLKIYSLNGLTRCYKAEDKFKSSNITTTITCDEFYWNTDKNIIKTDIGKFTYHNSFLIYYPNHISNDTQTFNMSSIRKDKYGRYWASYYLYSFSTTYIDYPKIVVYDKDFTTIKMIKERINNKQTSWYTGPAGLEIDENGYIWAMYSSYGKDEELNMPMFEIYDENFELKKTILMSEIKNLINDSNTNGMCINYHNYDKYTKTIFIGLWDWNGTTQTLSSYKKALYVDVKNKKISEYGINCIKLFENSMLDSITIKAVNAITVDSNFIYVGYGTYLTIYDKEFKVRCTCNISSAINGRAIKEVISFNNYLLVMLNYTSSGSGDIYMIPVKHSGSVLTIDTAQIRRTATCSISTHFIITNENILTTISGVSSSGDNFIGVYSSYDGMSRTRGIIGVESEFTYISKVENMRYGYEDDNYVYYMGISATFNNCCIVLSKETIKNAISNNTKLRFYNGIKQYYTTSTTSGYYANLGSKDMVLDSLGNIIVGSYTHYNSGSDDYYKYDKVTVYNKHYDIVTQLTHSSSYSSYGVSSIIVDNKGQIWIAYYNKLYEEKIHIAIYDKFYNILTNDFEFKDGNGNTITGCNYARMHVDSNGRIVIGLGKIELIKYASTQTMTSVKLCIYNDDFTFYDIIENTNYSGCKMVNCFCNDNYGNLWIGLMYNYGTNDTDGAKVLIYDRHYVFIKEIQQEGYAISALYNDSLGHMWVGRLRENGTYHKSSKINVFTTGPNSDNIIFITSIPFPYHLSMIAQFGVQSIVEDNKGLIYIGWSRKPTSTIEISMSSIYFDNNIIINKFNDNENLNFYLGQNTTVYETANCDNITDINKMIVINNKLWCCVSCDSYNYVKYLDVDSGFSNNTFMNVVVIDLDKYNKANYGFKLYKEIKTYSSLNIWDCCLYEPSNYIIFVLASGSGYSNNVDKYYEYVINDNAINEVSISNKQNGTIRIDNYTETIGTIASNFKYCGVINNMVCFGNIDNVWGTPNRIFIKAGNDLYYYYPFYYINSTSLSLEQAEAISCFYTSNNYLVCGRTYSGTTSRTKISNGYGCIYKLSSNMELDIQKINVIGDTTYYEIACDAGSNDSLTSCMYNDSSDYFLLGFGYYHNSRYTRVLLKLTLASTSQNGTYTRIGEFNNCYRVSALCTNYDITLVGLSYISTSSNLLYYYNNSDIDTATGLLNNNYIDISTTGYGILNILYEDNKFFVCVSGTIYTDFVHTYYISAPLVILDKNLNVILKINETNAYPVKTIVHNNYLYVFWNTSTGSKIVKYLFLKFNNELITFTKETTITSSTINPNDFITSTTYNNNLKTYYHPTFNLYNSISSSVYYHDKIIVGRYGLIPSIFIYTYDKTNDKLILDKDGEYGGFIMECNYNCHSLLVINDYLVAGFDECFRLYKIENNKLKCFICKEYANEKLMKSINGISASNSFFSSEDGEVFKYTINGNEIIREETDITYIYDNIKTPREINIQIEYDNIITIIQPKRHTIENIVIYPLTFCDNAYIIYTFYDITTTGTKSTNFYVSRGYVYGQINENNNAFISSSLFNVNFVDKTSGNLGYMCIVEIFLPTYNIYLTCNNDLGYSGMYYWSDTDGNERSASGAFIVINDTTAINGTIVNKINNKTISYNTGHYVWTCAKLSTNAIDTFSKQSYNLLLNSLNGRIMKNNEVQIDSSIFM